MSKNIYICEFCGCISMQHFGQCKHCETHDDGSRYKHYQKEEVKRLNKAELLEHINNINNFIKSGGIPNNKMDKNLLEQEMNRLKEQFDIIINNLEDKIEKKIEESYNMLQEKFIDDLNNMNDDLNNLSNNIEDKFELLKSKDNNVIDLKKKDLLKDIGKMHKEMEHTADNEINSKIIEDKIQEIKELKDKCESLNLNLQLKIKEKEEIKKAFDDIKNKLSLDKIEKEKLKKINKQGQKAFDDLRKENNKLQDKLFDCEKLVVNLKEENKSLKKDIKFWEENAEDCHPSFDEKGNKIPFNKPIIKGVGWSDEENKLVETLYKRFINNKDNKIVTIARKIEKELNKKGFDRNENAIKKKIYRLKNKKLI